MSLGEPDMIARRSAEILVAQTAAKARLAPTGADLERLLITLHTASAQAQRRARSSASKARAELYRRLRTGQTLVVEGREVVVAVVTNRELIGMVEAESNQVKTEAMAQRSYDVHRMMTNGPSNGGGNIESFIEALEHEEAAELHAHDMTERPAMPEPEET